MMPRSDGCAEHYAALLIVDRKQKVRSRHITLGAGGAYDTRDSVAAARSIRVTAHVTKNDNCGRSTLDGSTARYKGYAISLSCRWPIEKSFGWLKQTGPLRQVKLRGCEKVDWLFVFNCAAHYLPRRSKLIVQQSQVQLYLQCA